MTQPPGREQPFTGDTLPLGTVRPPQPAPPPWITPPQPAKRAAAPARLVARATQSRPGRASRPWEHRRPRTIGSTFPRLRNWRSILKRTVLGALVLLVLALVGAIVVQQQVAKAVALPDVRNHRGLPRPLIAPMNILLLGVDSRPDHPEEGVRSDSIVLLHIDPIGGWANLEAIPRDSVASIGDFGENKINVAFNLGHNNADDLYGVGTDPTAGGAALTADTAEQFLGLRDLGSRIDYMATINFDGFATMIDALGGIDVDVPQTIIDDEYPTPDFGTMRIEIPTGQQHFDGARALQYVRTRHADSDFGRGQRQQQVISAMVARLRGVPLPLRPFVALRFARAAGTALRTTLPIGHPDGLLLGLLLMRLQPAAIGQFKIDPDHATLLAQPGSDLVWDPGSIQSITRQALARPVEAAEHAVIQVYNGAGVAGLAGQLTDILGAQGFSLAEPATADLPTERSQIIDYTHKARTLKQLQQALGDIPVEQRPATEAPPGVDLMILLGDDYARFMPQQ